MVYIVTWELFTSGGVVLQWLGLVDSDCRRSRTDLDWCSTKPKSVEGLMKFSLGWKIPWYLSVPLVEKSGDQDLWRV